MLLDKFSSPSGITTANYWRTRMPQAMKPHRNCGLNFGTFSTQSGYEELDERKQLTAAKEELLLVLES